MPIVRTPAVGNDAQRRRCVVAGAAQGQGARRFYLNYRAGSGTAAPRPPGTCARGRLCGRRAVDLVGNALTDAGATTAHARRWPQGRCPSGAAGTTASYARERRGDNQAYRAPRGTGRGCSLLRSAG